MYHAVGAQSTGCVELLLDHGAHVPGTNALGSALDEERPEHVRLLLDAGGDPNEGALLAHAVRRGRGPDVVRLLAERGAQLDRPGGETWRGDVPLRTAYQHAVLRGRDDLVSTLEELGADTRLDPADEAAGALARGRRPEKPLPERLDPDGQEVVILSALRGHLDLALDVAGPHFRGVVGGSPAGTLLPLPAERVPEEVPLRLLVRKHAGMLDPLTTDRLVGERPRPEHRDGLLAVLGEPRVGEALWPGPLGGPRSAAQVQAILTSDAQHWTREGFGPWVLSERAGAGAIVARGGLKRAHVNGHDEVEIGYAVAASRWGEGLATEIARASVRVAFEELGLDEVVAFTRTTNFASQRVMDKAGLHRESEFLHVELPHVLFRARRTAW